MAFDITKYNAKPAPKPKAVTPAITATVATKPAETKPAETKPAETKPAETKPAETKPAETKTTVIYAPGFGPNRGAADGHRQGQLLPSSVVGVGRSAESEDADMKAQRDLRSYGMKLSMDRMFDIDRENRAQARKIQSAGWQMTGGHIDYNNVRSQKPTDFVSMLRPFDAPARTTMPSGSFVGIQNWDGVFHNPDQGKYLASTSKAMLGMDSLQKFVTTDKNGVKSFTADAFDKAWDSLSAKQKDEITGSYRKENVTHASAMEGNPHAPAIAVLGEGQRFAPGVGGNGQPGTIMTVARTADGKTFGSRYFDERNRGADVTLSAKTTNEVLSSDQARNGNLAGAMDAIRSGLEQRNADEAVSSARKKLDEETERIAASFD